LRRTDEARHRENSKGGFNPWSKSWSLAERRTVSTHKWGNWLRLRGW
jgi:hypothetical protein